MTTGTYKALTLEADTMSQFGGDIGILDRAGITLHSAVYSMANNAIQLGKWAGLTDEATPEWDLVDEYNKSGDMNLALEYGKSRAGYDLAGELLGSLVPAGLAMKGISLLKRGATVGRYLGWFDGRANKLREEIQTAYRLQGSAVDMSAKRLQMMGMVAGQQAVEGMLITAAIDATLNYGEILNSEGMSATEKAMKIGGNLALGGVLQGTIGGFFDYRKLKGLTDVTLNEARTVENSFMPKDISTRVGRLPVRVSAANKLVMSVGQYDEIIAMPAITDLEKSAQSRGLDLARSNMQASIADMFPKSDKSEYARTLREYLEGNISTAEGRASVANQFSSLRKFADSDMHMIDEGKLIDDMLGDVELMRVSRDTMDTVRKLNGTNHSYTSTSVATEEFGGARKLYVADDLSDDLANRQALAAHASLFRVKPADAKAFNSQLDEFAIQEGVTVNETLHGVLTKFYNRFTDGRTVVGTKFPAVAAYFSGIGEDSALAVYGNVSRTYLDSATQRVIDSPIKHIGDLKGFSYHAAGGSVVLDSSRGNLITVTTKDLGSLNATTDLHKYQALRLIASSPAAPAIRNKLENLTLAEAYQAEQLVLKSKPGQANLHLNSKDIYPREAILDKIAKVKGAEYNRLVAALPGESADNIYNSIGYTDLKGAASIIQAEKMGKAAMSEEEFLQASSKLSGKRMITMLHDKPSMNNAAVSASVIGESIRESMNAANRAVGASLLGLKSVDDLKILPGALKIEYPQGMEGRLLASIPTIGTYQGLIQQANRISTWLARTADDLHASKIAPAHRATGTSLASSPAAKAEYSALLAWYRTQADKYVVVGDGLIVEESLAPNIKALIATGTTQEKAVLGLVRGKQFIQIEHPETKAHFSMLQSLNREFIASKQLKANAAHGNPDSFNIDHVYFPPVQAPFMTFLSEAATSPIDSMSEKLYRITASSKVELEAKVAKAMRYASDNKLQWARRDADQINEYARAKGVFEWQNSQDGGFAKSAMQRLNLHDDLTPETDIHAILMNEAEWLKSSNMAVHRAGMELVYADDISKLNTLSRLETAQMKAQLGNQAELPMGMYDQLMHSMLGSDAHGFSTWKIANNTLEDWTSGMLSKITPSLQRIRRTNTAGKIAAITAETDAMVVELEKMGVKIPMADAVTERLARETQFNRADIRSAVSHLNGFQATLLLRLDFTDAGMNVIGNAVKTSGEMQYLRKLYGELDPEKRLAFDAEAEKLFGVGMTTTDIGTNLSFKSVAKVYKDLSALIFTDAGKARVDDLTARKLFVSEEKAMMDLFQEARIRPDSFKTKESADSWAAQSKSALAKLVDIGVTPSRWSSTVNQLVALEIAERLGKAAGMADGELDMFMHSFNGRVNVVQESFQKPRLFQGSAGIALSLYQSYIFHMMNNMFRYADNGANSATAMMTALNTSFFGATSLPGYQYINENIVGQHTKGNVDITGAASTALGASQGRDLSDFVLYGAGAFLLQGNMHTRGGLTPRSPVLVPTSIQDIPAASMIAKAYGSLTESASQIMYGAPVVSSLWDGLVNTGLNRPLVGLNTVLTGKSVDNQYNNVMLHEDIISAASVQRLAGMKPLNEQIGRDYQARQFRYKAHNAELKKALSKEIRILKEKNPESFDDPALIRRLGMKYMKAGGNAQQFDNFMQDQLVKGRDDLYSRLEDNAVRNSTVLSNFRDIFGGY